MNYISTVFPYNMYMILKYIIIIIIFYCRKIYYIGIIIIYIGTCENLTWEKVFNFFYA